MRPLEILILLLLLVALVTAYIPRRPRPRALKFLPAAILVLILAHLILEGYRWQMVPAYFLAAVLFLRTLPGLLKNSEPPPARGVRAYIAGGLGLGCWLMAITLPVILPVPRVPTPPGPYAVGSVLYDWTDASRAETYSPDPDAKRELMVQIWYPAQPDADSRTIPYLDNFEASLPRLAGLVGLPSFALDHLRLIKTHTFGDAPIRDDGEPYPVVILSHGYKGYRNEGFNQMEALASAGYIAVAIDHTYASASTVFQDGRVVVNDPGILPPEGRDEPGDRAMREELQAVISADQRFVLDQLQLLNEGKLDPRFAGRLDLQRIGLMGLSLGGGATVWTCSVDPRCKAGLAMDGWYEPLPQNILAEPLPQPFMFMQSETTLWKMDNLARLDQLYQNVDAPAYHLKLADVLHQDFSDYPLLTPLSSPLMLERGSLNGKRTVDVIAAYMLAFFDRYLKNRPSPLLNGLSRDYPEAQFESRSP
jgi:predicted dienelactone hydrolase